MVKAGVIAILLFAVQVCASAEARPVEPVVFVREFLATLVEYEAYRAQAEKDLKKAQPNVFPTMVRVGTRLSMILEGHINQMNDMELSGQYQGIPQKFADLFAKKRDVQDRFVDIAKAIIQGPKPGIDFGELAATAPQFTAMMEQADDTILKVSPLAFATLIRSTPDSKGHMSRLVITTKEKTALIHSIEVGFGSHLEAKNPNDLVSAGSIVRYYLRDKGYKCADEPGD